MSYGSSIQQRLFYASPPWAKNFVSSVYGWRERRHRHGDAYRRHFQAVEESQWWSTERHQELQLARLKEFLGHVGCHSPYFAELFQTRGLQPQKLTSLDDLARLPVLAKADFRANLERIKSRAFGPGDVHMVSTSGTSGLGLRFPETWDCFQREYAVRFHNYHCGGVELGDRWVICAGHPVARAEQDRPPFWVRDYVNNWLMMSSSHLTEKNLRFYVDELERFQPALVGGYPSSVYMLALANQACGRRVRPKAVYTASETLLDFQRSAIEASFGCKAYTYYGNGERCAFVAECERGSLHVRMDHSLVEFLDDRGEPAVAGVPARMICTGFGNEATPLVRYDVGDVAVVSPNQKCACGRGGILLDKLVGRVEDYIVTPDGRFAGRLDHLFKDGLHVRMAQIVQEKLARVVLRIVRDSGYSAAEEAAILKEARLRLGPQIQIDFEYVNDIARRPNGKFPFVVSKLKDKQVFGQKLAEMEK